MIRPSTYFCVNDRVTINAQIVLDQLISLRACYFLVYPLAKWRPSSSYLVLLFHAIQEEAELGVVMDNMSAGQELLRQKEDRLKVLENALLGGLVSNNHSNNSPRCSKFWENNPVLASETRGRDRAHGFPQLKFLFEKCWWQARPFSPATFSLYFL